MNKTLKKIMAIGFGTYLTAYTGLASYAILDYKKNQDKIFNEAPNLLIVKEYSAEINGKKKKLALVGEAHNYTDKESRYASEIMEKYGDIAKEGSDKEIKSKKFAKICVYVSIPSGYFYLTGSGRLAPNSSFLVTLYTAANNKRKFCLENQNPYDSLNKTQKGMILTELIKHSLTAPLEYFKGKSENELSLKDYKILIDKKRNNSVLRYLNNGQREEKMAKKIEEIISKDDIDSLACFIGASHLDNIDSILKEKLRLKDYTE